MRNVIVAVFYLIYLFYGFLFSCGFIGGYALLNALENEKGFIWILCGITVLVVVFITSVFWLLGKNKHKSIVADRIFVQVVIAAVFLAPLFYFIGGDEPSMSVFAKNLSFISIANAPLLVCVYAMRKKD